MSTAHIRFSTDILSRLGEELNPNADQGIIELVKNAYDADARNCSIELHNTDDRGGTIRIVDDGYGMDQKGIENGWLVLGRSTKSRSKRTPLGRIPAGSKGLGRLAALRLGQRAVLKTRPKNSPSRTYELRIDWNAYKNASVVEDIGLNIRQSTAERGSPVGTEICIEALRTKISRMDVKRLARALVLLADPFGTDPAGFTPVLVAPEFTDMEALVRNRYFSDAEFHLSATLDASGKARAKVVDWKGNTLFSADQKELMSSRNGKTYECPPAQLDLWIFILRSTAFTGRTSTLGEVRQWLSTFGGVHLYENGLRVSPYGNPGNDWLDMNLSRVRSPEERPGTNTSIGRISVTDNSGMLLQKTDRSGFIESDSFIELRTFAQDALEWLAKRRMEVAEAKRARARDEAPRRASRSKVRVTDAIEKASPKVKADVKQAFAAYERSRDKEVEGLQREVQLYRTLSTAGITAATFAHESRGNPIKVITQSNKTIERRGKSELGRKYESTLAKSVQAIFGAIQSLGVLSTATLKLIDWTKRRVGRVTVHKTINNILDTFEPFLIGRNVAVETDFAKGNPYLRGSEAALESILTNLLNNSLAAFERAGTQERHLLFRTRLEDNLVILSVLDNGPGIDGIALKDIWLPGQSTEASGTGLGLTIVRDTAKDLGGNSSVKEHGELGGAEFTVTLPILGA